MILSRPLLALGVVAGLAAPALAADLPSRTVPAAPLSALPAFTWTGFYVGLNAGAGFGSRGGAFTDPTYGSVSASGGSGAAFVGGGQVGYNYQFASRLVIGVEADFAGVVGGARRTYAVGTAALYDVGPSLDWLGTVRGRIGYAFDRLLIYGTGGLAYGGGKLPTLPATYPFGQPDSVRFGYAVGAGVEYAITPTISARIEGLYVNLDRAAARARFLDATTNTYYAAPRRDDGFGLVRAGVNYRF